jgi:hypothetical protein
MDLETSFELLLGDDDGDLDGSKLDILFCVDKDELGEIYDV